MLWINIQNLKLMKTAHRNLLNTFLAIMAISLSSCSIPRVHYVGDTFSPRDQIDTFYDKADIETEYKTIGHLVSIEFRGSLMLQNIQDEMTQEAKQRGADAIVFDAFEISGDQGACDDLRLKAQLIRYTLD